MDDHTQPAQTPQPPCNRLVLVMNSRYLYPYIEVEMRNGMEFKGFIVPTHLEPLLPDPRTAVRATPGEPIGITPTAKDFQDLVAMWNATPTVDPVVDAIPAPLKYTYSGGHTAAQLIDLLSGLHPDTAIDV